MNERGPLEKLLQLVEQRASGELICATREAEVHVFLQRGRIAWATDSEHPFAFTRQLQRVAQLDAEAFRDILESCRRERKPLGETLVSWGAASAEDVRDSLRHQVELALGVLRNTVAAQVVFLDRTRQFERYDSGFTFDVGELLSRTSMPPARPLSRPPSGSRAPRSSAPEEDLPARLMASADEVEWAELYEGSALLDAAPRRRADGRIPSPVTESTVVDGVEFVALRAAGSTIAGMALGHDRSLWCGITADATVGAAFAALAAFGPRDRSRPDDRVTPPLPRYASWVVGNPEAPAVSVLLGFKDRAPETLAALVTSLDEPFVCTGIGSGLPPDWAADLVRRRMRALASPLLVEAYDRASHPGNQEADFRFRSIATAEPQVWCFGAELETSPRRAVWVLLARNASQGLGWAYLTSLSRQLLHVRGWERHV